MSQEFDLIVIGSGPGGYVAAIRAGQLGMKVAVVEKDPKLGGTCLHRGCIPTKALLHTAELLDQVKKAGRFGVSVATPQLDMDKAQGYKNKVVAKNAKGIEFLFKKNKVEAVRGFGRVTGVTEVTVEDGEGGTRVLSAAKILIATGSVPRNLRFVPADGGRILNSDHILNLREVPESLVVLGGGAVGTEFASMFASFGSRVTLVEMMDRLLPIEDEEISAELTKVLKRRGIDVRTGTKLSEVQAGNNGVSLQLEHDGVDDGLQAEMLLVAVGRAPVTEQLGLEAVGVQLDRGFIQVDEWMRTAVPTIYAIGDVVPTAQLAHVASAEGILAVDHMAGDQTARPINYDHIPSCTYCDPEVGSVGLSEATARERGYDVAVGKFPFAALGKAAILGKTEGFVKIVRETQYDQLLGVHILGVHATELIAEACTALQVESTTEELFRAIHAHPTLSEAMAEAAHAAHGHAIHF